MKKRSYVARYLVLLLLIFFIIGGVFLILAEDIPARKPAPLDPNINPLDFVVNKVDPVIKLVETNGAITNKQEFITKFFALSEEDKKAFFEKLGKDKKTALFNKLITDNGKIKVNLKGLDNSDINLYNKDGKILVGFGEEKGKKDVWVGDVPEWVKEIEFKKDANGKNVVRYVADTGNSKRAIELTGGTLTKEGNIVSKNLDKDGKQVILGGENPFNVFYGKTPDDRVAEIKIDYLGTNAKLSMSEGAQLVRTNKDGKVITNFQQFYSKYSENYKPEGGVEEAGEVIINDIGIPELKNIHAQIYSPQLNSPEKFIAEQYFDRIEPTAFLYNTVKDVNDFNEIKGYLLKENSENSPYVVINSRKNGEIYELDINEHLIAYVTAAETGTTSDANKEGVYSTFRAFEGVKINSIAVETYGGLVDTQIGGETKKLGRYFYLLDGDLQMTFNGKKTLMNPNPDYVFYPVDSINNINSQEGFKIVKNQEGFQMQDAVQRISYSSKPVSGSRLSENLKIIDKTKEEKTGEKSPNVNVPNVNSGGDVISDETTSMEKQSPNPLDIINPNAK